MADTPSDHSSGSEVPDAPSNPSSGIEASDKPPNPSSGIEASDKPPNPSSGSEAPDKPPNPSSGSEIPHPPPNPPIFSEEIFEGMTEFLLPYIKASNILPNLMDETGAADPAQTNQNDYEDPESSHAFEIVFPGFSEILALGHIAEPEVEPKVRHRRYLTRSKTKKSSEGPRMRTRSRSCVITPSS